MESQADPTVQTSRRQATPLHTAAGTGNLQVAKALLTHPDTVAKVSEEQ